jgi:hypothetical protein
VHSIFFVTATAASSTRSTNSTGAAISIHATGSACAAAADSTGAATLSASRSRTALASRGVTPLAPAMPSGRIEALPHEASNRTKVLATAFDDIGGIISTGRSCRREQGQSVDVHLPTDVITTQPFALDAV